MAAGEPERFHALEQPGAGLLAQLLELLQEEPHLTSGAVLERFRENEYESAVWKLAAWDHLVPEGGAEEEFRGALERLDGMLREQRLQELQSKLEGDGLTGEERDEWLELLQDRAGRNS